LDPRVSHRFGPLTGPLDVTGICVDSKRILTGLSQYPVFKVQAQRGDTLLVPIPAVNRFRLPISTTFASSFRGMQNAPAFSAGGVGWAPDQYGWLQHFYPIALSIPRAIKSRSVSERSAEAALVMYHRTGADASIRASVSRMSVYPRS